MYSDRTPKRLAIVLILALALSVIFAVHAAAETIVSVDAPDFVSGSTFDAEIMIENVDKLDTGEFCLLFDPNVLNVTGVTAGNIGTMNIGFANKRDDKVQGIGIIGVTFDISGTDGVSGSGSLAVVGFEVTGTDGTCSILNISNPKYVYLFNEGKLWDGSAEEITAKWDNDMVYIGAPSSSDDPPDSDNLIEATDKAYVTVFVNNRDDDKLDVELYIDGTYKKNERVSKDAKEEYSSYTLDEGSHTFKIRWYDSDTDEWYEKAEEHSVSGTTSVTLMTDEHDEDEDKLSAQVYVNNLDDDDLNVYLYIDDEYREYKSISSDSVGNYGEYEFDEDEDELHAFKIEWFDPGTGEDYEKITRSYITGEEAVTLYIDKHTKEDIVVLPDETPTPVRTTYTPATTSTRSSGNPQPSIRNTPESTVSHTDPAPSEDSTEESAHSENGITPLYTLVGFIAAVFALFQIGRS